MQRSIIPATTILVLIAVASTALPATKGRSPRDPKKESLVPAAKPRRDWMTGELLRSDAHLWRYPDWASILTDADLRAIARGKGPTQTPRPILKPEQIVEQCGKAVVMVIAERADGSIVQGTGFFTSRDGMLLTNYHIVEDAEIIRVRTLGSKSLINARQMDIDKQHDIALLKAGGASNRPWLEIGGPRVLRMGEPVYVIGNPEGLDNTISDGLLSGRRGKGMEQVLQISAPISRGSSGSPVFDRRGLVIGIVVALKRDGQNLNFAIPIEMAFGLRSNTKRRL